MTDDKRKSKRITQKEPVFVEVLSSSANEDGGLVVQCTTKDISSSGLMVVANYPITVGAILEILIELEDDASKFLLTGEVKWCTEVNKDPTFHCGFELIEAEHSDIFAWRKLFQ